MRVNNISVNNLNFTRAIEVRSNTNDLDSNSVDKATRDVLRTFQGKRSSYHSNKRNLIITFFSRYIDKYARSNEKFDIIKIDGRVYIFTGEDALKAAEIKRQAQEDNKRLSELYKSGINDDMPETDKKALQNKEVMKFLQHNIGRQKNKNLLELVEDGTTTEDSKRKPNSFITLDINKEGRLKSIEYCSTLEYAKTGESTKTLFL